MWDFLWCVCFLCKYESNLFMCDVWQPPTNQEEIWLRQLRQGVCLTPMLPFVLRFWLCFFFLLPGEGNLKTTAKSMRHDTHSLSLQMSQPLLRKQTLIWKHSSNAKPTVHSWICCCFFYYYSALITASQLEYCCFYVASAGLLSSARVITSVSLFCEMRGKGNESFCFPRSHNIPSEGLDACDHFYFCSLLQWLSPRWQALAAPRGWCCVFWYAITANISEEQSGDLWSATAASVVWDSEAAWCV